MKRLLLSLIPVFVASGPAFSETTPPDLVNYQGVLRDSSDHPVEDGSYNMVFRFFDDADPALPENEILYDTQSVQVSGGLFNVKLGTNPTDGSGSGTYGSLGEVFRDFSDLYLQLEVNGEVLSPRVQVIAAGFSLNSHFVQGWDLVSEGPLDLYVDGSPGGCGGAGCSDSNDGLSSAKAKKTIQAAVDAIPAIITNDVTIHISAGTYSENISIGRNLTLLREGTRCAIRLSGNTSVPSSVTVDGSSGSLEDGINVYGVFVAISGMRISGFSDDGVDIGPGSTVQLEYCEITGNGERGVEAFEADVFLSNVDVLNNTAEGIYLGRSYSEMDNVTVQNNTYGIYCETHCWARLAGGLSFSGNTMVDMHARDFSLIRGFGTAGSCTYSGEFSACDN